MCNSLGLRLNMSVFNSFDLYFNWNTKYMDKASEPPLSLCSLLTHREATSGRCHQSLPPKNQVTPFVPSHIFSALCIAHNVEADGGASKMKTMTRNTLSAISFHREIQQTPFILKSVKPMGILSASVCWIYQSVLAEKGIKLHCLIFKIDHRRLNRILYVFTASVAEFLSTGKWFVTMSSRRAPTL